MAISARVKAHLPWRTDQADMLPGVLLTCKLLLVLLMLHGYWGYIRDPYLPFIPFLDWFSSYSGVFEYTLKTLFVLSGFFLFFNVKTRLFGIVLGLCVLLVTLASKSTFKNHLFIVSCVFILGGLQSKEDEKPHLLYLQLALVYFGAALNKMLQWDWWDGQYMHNWFSVILEHPLYSQLQEWTNKSRIPAQVIGWFSMGIELVIGFLLLHRKKYRLAILLILFFHLFLFTLTKERFGHFLDDILIILISFAGWPRGKTTYQSNSKKTLKIKILKLLDWNDSYHFEVSQNEKNGLTIFTHKHFLNALLGTVGFYVGLFALDLAIRILFENPMQHILQCVAFWGTFLYFIPVFFERPRNTITH
ncbi:MAG: HTTM domain-containing protein [Bacteroidota bacterium]